MGAGCHNEFGVMRSGLTKAALQRSCLNVPSIYIHTTGIKGLGQKDNDDNARTQ